LDELNYAKELEMYKTNAIGPTFLVQHLVHAGLLKNNSRVVLVSGESGSIALRHETGGGGNYGGHASKAALNMVGKLLSIDLKSKGIAVATVHTGYLRKQNADGFYETGDKHGKRISTNTLNTLEDRMLIF
jgi:NAD(P)-dependent dehydrogenase (short-subunit alcohol dehydrogenase family)